VICGRQLFSKLAWKRDRNGALMIYNVEEIAANTK
jgi:hypothetical protein